MYTLYRCKDTAGLAPQILMEEAGILYEIVEISIEAGDTQSPEYLAINPSGVVPSLACPDGRIIYETAAIMLFLAEEAGATDLAPPVGDPDRALFLRTLFYISNNVHALSNLNHYADRYVQDETGLSQLRSNSLARLLDSWKPIDALLAENGPYCLGNRFSLLDLYIFLIARWHEPPKELFEHLPALKRCYDLVAKRPCTVRTVHENMG